MYRIPVESYDAFCKRIKKITDIVIEKEDTPIQINDTRKSLGEKGIDGKTKQTACWIGIKLLDEYARELNTAKIKEQEQETID